MTWQESRVNSKVDVGPALRSQRATHAHDPELLLTVMSRKAVTPRVVEIQLGLDDGTLLAPWEPGSHIELVLPSGLVRQYSLIGSPSDRTMYRIAVQHEPDGRGGSAEIHKHVLPGTRLEVREPRNLFALDPFPRYCFIAGGIGITPLLAMLDRAQSRSSQWTLHYGGRTASSMAYADVLLARFGALRVRLVPQDSSGPIDAGGIVRDLAPGTIIYCCGPEGLTTAVEDAAAEYGFPFRFERFSPPGRAASAPPDGQQPFVVVLGRSGAEVTVPAGVSVLDAVSGAGVEVESSCEEGFCGTCETTVLDGSPDHRDLVGTPDDHTESMMICVSRSRTPRLTLDL